MNIKSNNQIRVIYFLIDIAVIIVSYYSIFRLNPDLAPDGGIVVKTYLPIYFFWTLTLVSFLHNAHLYYTDRYLSISGEWLKVGRCVLLAAILTGLFVFILKFDVFSRTIFIESTVTLFLSLSIWRMLKRIYVRQLITKGYANYNILIVGAGKVGLTLADEIKTFPYLGIRTVGFLDDIRTDGRDEAKVLGKISDLDQVVKRFFIDEIYITIPSERGISSEIIKKGKKLGKTVRVVADHFGLPYSLVKLNYVGAIPLLAYFEKSDHGTDSWTKRLMDIVISGLALILLLPLFIIVSFIIKLENSGPVFYISKRCGKKGVIFDFYKFRSMINNADCLKDDLRDRSEVKGPIFKIRNDPRLTRVGRFMRKYSIDELPQLINVLKGDMSLVGPRPFPVEESQQIEYKHIPRLNIKPGITGLAQVKGRSDLTFSRWMRWDNWYLHNWSLGLDIKILLWTIPAILKSRGAY